MKRGGTEMVRYEVKVSECDDHYRVSVICYRDPNQNSLAPRIGAHLVSSGGSGPPFWVRPPNAIERLFSLSLESKLERAKRKAQRIADRENRKVAVFRREAI